MDELLNDIPETNMCSGIAMGKKMIEFVWFYYLKWLTVTYHRSTSQSFRLSSTDEPATYVYLCVQGITTS